MSKKSNGNRFFSLAIVVSMMVGMLVFTPIASVSANLVEVEKTIVFKAGAPMLGFSSNVFGGWQDTELKPFGTNEGNGGASGTIRLFRHDDTRRWARGAGLLRFDLGIVKNEAFLEDITGATLTFTLNTGETHIGGSVYNMSDTVELYRINDVDGDWRSDESQTDWRSDWTPSSWGVIRGQYWWDSGSRKVNGNEEDWSWGHTRNWKGGYQLGSPGKDGIPVPGENYEDPFRQAEAGDPVGDGGSYEETPVATAAYVHNSEQKTLTFDIPKEDVLNWINNPIRILNDAIDNEQDYNNGLFMRLASQFTGTDEGRGIAVYTANHSDPALRPTLTVKYEDMEEEGLYYGDVEFTDHNNKEIDGFLLSQKNVTAAMSISNATSAEKSVFMILALYEGTGKLLRALDIRPYTFASMSTGDITASLDLTDITLAPDDYFKVMVWDKNTTEPLIDAVPFEKKQPAVFVRSSNWAGSDNSRAQWNGFNANFNELAEDSWSYWGATDKYSDVKYQNGEEKYTPSLMSKRSGGGWHLNGDNFIQPHEMVANGSNEVISVFTIGEQTAGKDLRVSAWFGNGHLGENLYGTIVLTDDFGNIDSFNPDIMEDEILAAQNGCNWGIGTMHGQAELVIPASKVLYGRKIMFIVGSQVGDMGYMQVTADIEAAN